MAAFGKRYTELAVIAGRESAEKAELGVLFAPPPGPGNVDEQAVLTTLMEIGERLNPESGIRLEALGESGITHQETANALAAAVSRVLGLDKEVDGRNR